jgi:2-polyprenyl-3-methyl-5-hydroxy-6-metoxy-1,4-benzoquinol methylase
MAIGRFGATNREYWDGEVDLNLKSWDVDAFFSDRSRPTRIVAADRQALGDVNGKSLIHLQCHFGLDTLAWARLGAEVTGVDFSPRAIATAIDLAKRDGARARFVEAEVHGDQLLLEVHDAELLAYLETAWEEWRRSGLTEDPGQDRVVP